MDETLTDLFVNRFLGPIIRTGVAGFLGILTAHGFVFDASLGPDFVKALLPLLVVLAASVWQKFQAAKLTAAALKAQPGTPLAAVKASL